jgi:hypothetical protein
MVDVLVELQAWEFVAHDSLATIESQTPIAVLRIPIEINETEAQLLCDAILERVVRRKGEK